MHYITVILFIHVNVRIISKCRLLCVFNLIFTNFISQFCRKQNEKKPIISILSIPRTDLKLRSETKLLLQKCGIKEEWLLFSDEFGILSSNLKEGLALTLVDHNQLSIKLSSLDKV